VDAAALKTALATVLPRELADHLVDQFLEIRTDVATKTLGRGSPGKFVESTVQALQALEQNGSYDAKPDVDKYLRGLDSRASTLPDGLRICCARLARAMYALRSKRNIVHKGDVDPSLYDLQMLYAGAQWTLAELLALSPGISGEEASRLVAQVQLPVGGLVEVLGDRHLVHGDLTVPEEALVLLMNHYPTPITVAEVRNSMDRRSPGSVDNALRDLWKGKLVHRPATGQVVLTERGMREAIKVAQAHAA
jgi:hypothetical protein